MKIIKKVFPNYKSKQELNNEIATLNKRVGELNGYIHMPQLTLVERNVCKLQAATKIDQFHPIPTKYLKHEICHKLADMIIEHVEFDLFDSDSPYEKVLLGKLYVAINK